MEANEARALCERLRAQVHRQVVGQDRAIDLLLTALLCEGHVLLEGVPGTAKTLLARCFSAALRLMFGRIQFTPDLMPGDVLGTNIFDFRTNQFVLTQGPIFTQILLADEINRAPPKTQAALLQAMQERAVTLDRQTHDLGPGFLVIATQNPLEQEGTYPLPEAQLDRFLFRVRVGYPEREDERQMVRKHGISVASPADGELGIEPVADLPTLVVAREAVRRVEAAEPVLDYAVDLVRATREQPLLAAGASPRSANMLCAAARAWALLQGRTYVIPDDVKQMLLPVLEHRVVLAPAAEIEGQTAGLALEQVLAAVPAPR